MVQLLRNQQDDALGRHHRRIAEALDVSCDYLLVERAPRRPFDTPTHPLADRLTELAELPDADQAAVLHILDALIAKKRVTNALSPDAG